MAEQRRAFWQLQPLKEGEPPWPGEKVPPTQELLFQELTKLRLEVAMLREALLPGKSTIITGIEVQRTMEALKWQKKIG